MALTKVTGQVVSNTTDVTVGVLTVSGISTFTGRVAIGTDLRVEGSVSVGGTITYEDVTNIDAVGLVTARNGIVVGSGITLSKDGDGFFTGVVTATSYAGDGSALTGIAATDNVRTGILDVAGVGTFRNDVNIPDKIIHLGDTDTTIRFPDADTISVETGGSERARFDSNGRLLLGNTSSRSVGDVTAQSQIEGTSYQTSSLSLTSNAGASAGNIPHLTLGKSRGSSDGSNTIVADGDKLGIIQFAGADGTDCNTVAASILSNVDGAPGSNDMPGRLTFNTTADNAATPTERVRIESAGNVKIEKNLNVVGVCTAATVEDSIGELRTFPVTAYGSNVVIASHHAGKTLTNTSGGWTFNGSTDFAVGEVMRVVNKSGSSQTVGQASGSTVYSSRDGGTSGDHSIKARGSAIIICTATDEYYVSGDI